MKPAILLLACSASALAAPPALHDTKPAANWQNDGYPIGNGALGAVVFGGTDTGTIQFTVDSLWTGDDNPSGVYRHVEKTPGEGCFGSYQNFGDLIFQHDGATQSGPSVSIPQDGNHMKLFKAPQQGQTIAESIDGNPQTKWCLEHGNRPILWQADLGEEKQLASYTFTSANDVPGRDPGTWKLEGSDDGKTWATLDERRDLAPMEKRHGKTSYKLTKPATHRLYRFVFQARPDVSHFQVAEISLDGISLTAEQSAGEGYLRELNIQRALHSTTWTHDGVTFKREAIASHPDQVLAWRLTADRPGSINGILHLKGAHPDLDQFDHAGNAIRLKGTLANGLRYEARATVIPEGGTTSLKDDGIRLDACDSALVLLAADTNYVMDHKLGWMRGDPGEQVALRLDQAARKKWDTLLQRHEADHRAFFDRVSIDLGTTDPAIAALPTKDRIARYRADARDLPRPCLDPALEALLFQYGRYLLIASSRPGTLPANLQGIWNNSNKPAWFADYHSNINLQMNYWLGETTNLPELTEPLFSMLTAGAPVYRKYTALEYGADTQGYVTRMSINPYGGTGWNWNIEGTAWLAQHFWESYQFSGDKDFLDETAWPFLRDVSLFWLGRLKELPDGQLVVPNAWSHEHGPYEDGTAHAQQLMWDLFTNTLAAARILDTAPDLQKRLTTTIAKLYGPKIGSWGQLMEWMEEKPKLEKGNHRHTSHLYAVHPGNQITMARTPELADAARASLTQRGEVGDSRRSWTWAWRTALWSRLGEPERAHGCVAGLLAHNTLDNLWTTHPPFQIDGNFGITGGMAEIFLQSHAGEITLLPALPKAWPTGSIKGLRARGNVIVDLTWKDGQLRSATLAARRPTTVQVRFPDQKDARSVELPANQPVTIR